MSVLAEAITGGDRRALSRAITLVESTRATDRSAARQLLTEVLPHAGGAVRIGISGAPGVGKSTLIEALGLMLIADGRRLAVLAVDPSSARSGGSILGDRTRMEELSREERAFIRPSPSGGALGGVARRTREAALLAEAWGAEVILIETVGVGQSEIAVAGMTDQFVLLTSPGGGDELQGIKRGVMELADLIVVNKADGELAAAADRALMEYTGAAHLMRPRHSNLPTAVLSCSAVEKAGLSELWSTLADRHATLASDGRLARLREDQALEWFWAEIRDGLLEEVDRDEDAAELAKRREIEIAAGTAFPPIAADEVVAAVLKRIDSEES